MTQNVSFLLGKQRPADYSDITICNHGPTAEHDIITCHRNPSTCHRTKKTDPTFVTLLHVNLTKLFTIVDLQISYLKITVTPKNKQIRSIIPEPQIAQRTMFANDRQTRRQIACQPGRTRVSLRDRAGQPIFDQKGYRCSELLTCKSVYALK